MGSGNGGNSHLIAITCDGRQGYLLSVRKWDGVGSLEKEQNVQDGCYGKEEGKLIATHRDCRAVVRDC